MQVIGIQQVMELLLYKSMMKNPSIKYWAILENIVPIIYKDVILVRIHFCILKNFNILLTISSV